MRRFVAALLCLVLALSLAATVSAAGAKMSLSVSDSTLYRGDSFTVTVKLSNSEAVSNGGVVLTYDKSIFEFVKGSVIDCPAGEVTSSGGVFSLADDTVVSGVIFTIVLKVKSDAPFGKHPISGKPNLASSSGKISCDLSGTSVTVACKHSYGSSAKIDDTSHESACTVCGEKKTEKHSWNKGTVTKAATCKDPGSKTLQCGDCGAEKTETVSVTNDHKYGSWSKVSDSQHKRICSVCGKESTAAHSWNEGKVTKKATCQETGTKELTCTGCKTTKTETVAKTKHTYSAWTQVDDTTHTHACTVCGLEEPREHSYGDAWDHDENGHFKTCTGCGHVKDWTAHTPGPEPTETTDQLCTVCSRILRPNTAHDHVYDTAWTTDELGHWYSCTICSQKEAFALHAFESGCAAACQVCTAEREAPHNPGKELACDATGHWLTCADCGEKVEFAEHSPGAEATTSKPQLCTACGYEIAPILPHDHVYNGSGSTHTHECACGEPYEADAKTCEVCLAENKPFPWWTVCVGEAVVFGGIITALLLRGRKKKTEE